MNQRRLWTAEELLCLRIAYPEYPTEAIARHLSRPLRAVYAKARDCGLHKSPAYLASAASGRLTPVSAAGVNHRFKPGQKPWNAGRKGWTAGGRSAETRFRPGALNGRAAQLYQPIGAYRINSDGILDRKVRDDGLPQYRWVGMHRLVWEAVHGPIPRGHAVVFRPGRRTTDPASITLDALELVTRAEIMRRNTLHRYPKELARLIQLRGALMRQINRRVA